MIIKEIKSIHDPVYSDLVSRAGTVFNSPGWLALYGNKLQLFGIYSSNVELAGAFFLYRDRKAGFSFFKNPPYTPHIGWMFENKSQNQAIDATKRLIDEAHEKSLCYFGIDFHDRYFSKSFKTWMAWYTWLTGYLIECEIGFCDFRHAVESEASQRVE